MPLSLQATSISRGIAIGPVHILRRGDLDISEYVLAPQFIPEEVERYRFALNTTREYLRQIRNTIPARTPADIAAFIDTHLLMLEDAAFSTAPVEIIHERQCNAEWALKLQRDALVSVFDEMDDAYLRTRRDDIDHVVNSILQNLAGRPSPHEEQSEQAHLLAGHIVIAHDLTPAETVLMYHQGIVGFVTEGGGPTSHTAILARSLRLPALAGLLHARQLLSDEEPVVIVGQEGHLLAGLDPMLTQEFALRRRADEKHYAELAVLRDEPAQTRDGIPVTLCANVELPSDLDDIAPSGAEGIGLYRTEFLFMNRATPPNEEEQLEVYLSVVQRLQGAPLTIRSIDLGADKPVNDADTEPAYIVNPALGLRGVRLCLQESSLFIPQLRAILRASASGPVRLMLPMVSNAQEIVQARNLIQQLKRELDQEKLAYDPRLPVGVMIEVPAAAINAHMLAEFADFFSIGTNDLIQYTLAIDRIDEQVNYLYDPFNPAVLHLVHSVIQAGNATGTPVSMCGEMAGDPRFTRLLLGLGLREFSMHTSALLEVKSLIKRSDGDRLFGAAKKLMTCANHQHFCQLLDIFHSTD